MNFNLKTKSQRMVLCNRFFTSSVKISLHLTAGPSPQKVWTNTKNKLQIF